MFEYRTSKYIRILIPLILSILFIHVPLIYFIVHHSFDKDVAQKMSEKKEKVVMVNLKQMQHLPIADIQQPKVQKRPQNPSAQSLYDSSVKQETVSKSFNKNNIPKGSPQPTTHNPQPKSPRAQPPTPKSQTSMQDQLSALINQQKQKEQKKYAQRYETKKKTQNSFQTKIGSPQGGNTDDFLPNYKVGNRTFLNTMANPYIAYYVELRRKFRFAWNPVSVLRYQANQISHGQLTVVWGVSVDASGKLAGLTLIKGSGNKAYDQECKRTIKVSSPFSRPPESFLTKDRQLHMAWTFVVYM